MHDFKHDNNKLVYKKNKKNITNYHPRVHIIIIYNSSVFFLYKKLKTSRTTSLLLIRTSRD